MSKKRKEKIELTPESREYLNKQIKRLIIAGTVLLVLVVLLVILCLISKYH